MFQYDNQTKAKTEKTTWRNHQLGYSAGRYDCVRRQPIQNHSDGIPIGDNPEEFRFVL